jgi:hypothetical protein
VLGAAGVPAKAGDDLIEDQHDAMDIAQMSKAGEVPGVRWLGGLGLEYHGRDAPRVGLEQLFHCCEIVVGERDS